MTRYAPRRVPITQLPAVGSGQAANICTAVVNAITSQKFDGFRAWEVFDNLGNDDYLLRSRGDRTLMDGRGDTDIFVRMTSSAGVITHQFFSDYSTIDGVPGRRTQPANSTSARIVVSDTELADVYLAVNQYEFGYAVKQATNDAAHVVGEPRLLGVPPSMRGRSRLSAAVGASGGQPVDLPLRSDLRGQVQPGQKIWGIDITPEGQAMVTEHVEVMTVSSDVDAVGSDYVRVASVAAAFGEDALIGLFPQRGVTGGSHTTGSGDRVYVQHQADGSYTGADQAFFRFGPEQVVDNVAEFGIVTLGKPFLYHSTGPAQVIGCLDTLAAYRDSLASLNPYDIWYPNQNVNGGYRLLAKNFDFASNYFWALFHGTTG